MHQFQQVSIRKRPKDSAGTSQKSHPSRPLIVFREYSTKKRKKGRGKEMNTKISKEAFELHFPRDFLRKEISKCPVLTLSKLCMGPSIICFVTSFTPKAYPPPSSTLCPPPFCQARHAVWLTKPCRNPSRLSFHTS